MKPLLGKEPGLDQAVGRLRSHAGGTNTSGYLKVCPSRLTATWKGRWSGDNVEADMTERRDAVIARSTFQCLLGDGRELVSESKFRSIINCQEVRSMTNAGSCLCRGSRARDGRLDSDFPGTEARL